MKPTIPEKGLVTKIEGNIATIALKSEGACHNCGAGKLGLCKPSGGVSTITAKDKVGAQVGDTVRIGMDSSIQVKGFLLAFIIPIICFVAGSVMGLYLNRSLAVPFLEVMIGFASLIIASLFTFKKLRKIDKNAELVILGIVSDNSFKGYVKSEEEKRYETYFKA